MRTYLQKITESLIANPSTALFAFQYNNLEKEPHAREIAFNCPNFSLFCRDGAVINGVEAPWRTGILPAKNWQSIRDEYFKNKEFQLGDFNALTRFLATAGGDFGFEIENPTPALEEEQQPDLDFQLSVVDEPKK